MKQKFENYSEELTKIYLSLWKLSSLGSSVSYEHDGIKYTITAYELMSIINKASIFFEELSNKVDFEDNEI